MTDDLIARLEKRASEWDAQVDGWLKQAEDAGQKVGAETERVMRDTIYREAAEEIKRLREGLANIESGACIEEWGHKPEGQFQDYAAAILRGESPPVWETCSVCYGIGSDPEGDDTCAKCDGAGRVTKPACGAE